MRALSGWLNEGHLPVAHIVAELDELEGADAEVPAGGTSSANGSRLGEMPAASNDTQSHKTHGMIQYLGYIAGLLTVGAFLPQVVRAWRTRQTRDLSMATFALLITTGSLWMIYGIVTGDWPVIAANGGMVTLNAALAVAKLRYG